MLAERSELIMERTHHGPKREPRMRLRLSMGERQNAKYFLISI